MRADSVEWLKSVSGLFRVHNEQRRVLTCLPVIRIRPLPSVAAAAAVKCHLCSAVDWGGDRVVVIRPFKVQ